MFSRRATRRAAIAFLLSSCIIYVLHKFVLGPESPALAAGLVPFWPLAESLPFTLGQATGIDARPECKRYPDDGSIAMVVKTGATEAFRKLPAILNTSLACVHRPLVFSDLEQKLSGLQIYDALSRYSRTAMKGNPDFEIYRKQLELVMEHRENELESLTSLLAPERDWETANKSASWGLDKYKFVHMIEMTYELQPGRDWYVFVEADTYLSWTNLKRWLPRVDNSPAKNKLYLGNAMRKSSRPPRDFAHGGSGFILSGAAVRELAVDRKGAARRADLHAHKYWAGDMMLADVLNKELAVQVTNVAPHLHHMDSALQVPEDWMTQRVVAAHHIESSDFAKLYEHERISPSSGILLRDIYDIVEPTIEAPDDLASDRTTDTGSHKPP